MSQQVLNSLSLKDIPKILPLLTEAEQRQLLLELETLQELKRKEGAQTRFMDFVKEVWPTFITGRHHKRMAEAFERVEIGRAHV